MFFAVAVLGILTMCNKDEYGARPFTRLITYEVSDISDSGVTCTAELVNRDDQAILEYGFIYSTDSITSIHQGNKIVVKPKENENIFSYRIDQALITGQLYRLRSYLITANYIVYGNIVTFDSKGSRSPVIKSFTPLVAFCGDTLKIVGSDFSPFIGENIVKLNDQELFVVSASDSLILAIAESNTDNVTLKISVQGKEVIAGSTLKMIFPSVKNLYPLIVGIGDTITLTGENLDKIKNFKMELYGFETKPVLITSDSILFSIFNYHSFSNEQNVFISNCGNFNLNKQIAYKPPVIDTVYPELITNADQTITIVGKYFIPRFQSLSFFSTDLFANIDKFELAHDQIKFNVPKSFINGISKTTEVTIRLNASDQEIQYRKNLKFQYESYWSIKKPFPGETRFSAVAFSMNDKGYYGLGQDHDNNFFNNFWQYDPKTDIWIQINSFPGESRSQVSVFVHNGIAYIGLGYKWIPTYVNGQLVDSRPNYFSDFYSLDSETLQWNRIADFPFETRHNSGGCIIKNEAYLIGGMKFLKGPNLDEPIELKNFNDTYRYNLISKSWEKSIDAPDLFPDPDCIEYDNAFYIFDQNGFYKFNGDTWNILNTNNIPDSRTIFRIGNTVYFEWLGTDKMVEFNLLSGITSPSVYEHFFRVSNASFVIENKGYKVGLTGKMDNSVWQFDPSKTK